MLISRSFPSCFFTHIDPIYHIYPLFIHKIDVEGFEPLVIAGMQNLLSSGLVENLIVEVSPVSPLTQY